MAVQSDTSRIQYTGNNSTVTSYAVPFVFLENDHLSAIARVTATGVESTVTLTNHTGAGDVNGGTVRTSVAVPATSTLTIYREVPATQTTTYQEGGDFPAASHERALDKLTFISQQNERAVERSFRVTEASGSKNAVVAVPNTLLGLDASNQPKAMTLSEVKTYLALSGVTIDVNAGMKTFADAGERALAVPDFTGQLGTQRDTGDIYIATGTSAGDWSLVDENMSLADFAAGFFTADALGRGKFASEFVDSGLLADDAVTTAKIDDDAVTTAKIEDDAVTTAKILDANVTPAKLSQPYTLATSVASTSGTSIDFTGIPSWAKRITVLFSEVSLSGISSVLVRMGTSGGIVSSNYLATGGASSVSGSAAITSTGGFPIYISDAAGVLSGSIVISNITGTNWIATHAGKISTAVFVTGGGSCSLGGVITQVRITTVNGTDTFDNGTINISYEG